MAHDYSISDFGLKLIKAYEGFRPAETVLVSGQRVIGYGHEYVSGEASVLTQNSAAELLKTDLEPFEDMINHNIFAPLSQNQFDALVSLGFSIGPKAFLNSSVVRNLNIGKPLAAAAGFDEWRKSVIADKTYIVDALVRRRTAEKALFLSPATGIVAAPRKEVPPLHDSAVNLDADDTQIFSKSDANGYVERAPYAAEPTPQRRREDGPSGILTLSERVPDAPEPLDEQASEQPIYEESIEASSALDITNDDVVENPVTVENVDESTRDTKLSPIALAAAEVSERLDNLMEDRPDGVDTAKKSQEIEGQQSPKLSLVVDGTSSNEENTLDASINDELETEAVLDADKPIANENSIATKNTAGGKSSSESKLQNKTTKITQERINQGHSGMSAYWSALLVGLLLLGGAWWKLKYTAAVKLDEMSAFLAPVALLVGAMMILGGLYYLLKAHLQTMSE